MLYYCTVFAQPNSISGVVRNKQNETLPQTSVSLQSISDKKPYSLYTESDSTGYYRFEKLPTGNYVLTASHIGYLETISDTIIITASGNEYPYHFILIEDSAALKEVTVTSKKQQIEIDRGKIIFNVQSAVATAGLTAFDLLKKLPGVTVNQDENILLKGNPNVNVMIDGKMTYLPAQQLTLLLKSMTSESVFRIEVSSNPSSEFDAAGNAGVINIVTKKINRDGYALDLGAGAGTGRYPQTSQSITGNIKTKHFNFFGSYNYYYKKSYLNRTSYRVIQDNGETIVYDRHSFDPDETSNNNYKAGVDLYFNKRNQLSLIYNGYSNSWSRNAAGPTYLQDVSGKVDSVVLNHNVTHEPQHNNAFSINYNLKLDTIGNNYSINADYASYKSNSDGFLGNQVFAPGGDPLQPYQQLNFQQPSDITIRSIKGDLRHALNKINFKTGLKYSDVRSDNNSVYDSLINHEFVYSAALSNHFIYDEKIFAIYISASRQLKNTAVDAGLRVENTASTGNSVTAKIVTKRNYISVFPYASIDHTIDDNNKIGISVTRRIDRPVYSNLNPFRYFFDKYSYYEGNPFLQPEYAWIAMLSYTLKNKYVAQFTYTHTRDPIAEFATQDSATGILKVTTYNFSHKYHYDALFIIPVTISKFWNMQNTVDVFYVSNEYRQVDFNIHKLSAAFTTTQTFKLPAGIFLEITADYETPTISGSYILHHWFTTDAGLKKSFKKLDVRLTCTDIFKTIHYWGYSAYAATNISYNHTTDSRRVNLGLTYHFGGKISEVKREKLEEENRL